MILRSVELTDISSVLECLSLATNATTTSNGCTLESTTETDRQRSTLLLLADESHRTSSTGVQFIVAVEDMNDDGPTNRQEGMGVVVLGFLVMKRYHHLSMLFVRPTVQRQGIGRRLWDHVMRTALLVRPCRTTTTTRIIVTVNSSPTAVTFYQNLGFHITGEPFEKYHQMLTPMILDCTTTTTTTTTTTDLESVSSV